MPLANPLLGSAKLRRYRGIHVEQLARAMLGTTRAGRRGVTRYTWEALVKLAARNSAGGGVA